MDNLLTKTNSTYTKLFIYSTAHGLIDLSCAVLLFGYIMASQTNTSDFVFLIILYNVLAFALQAPLGLLSDKFRLQLMFSILGCIFVAISLLLFKLTIIAVCIAGVGNALFHIGGGIFSLRFRPGSAVIPGIFVAPGALGLIIGTLLGKSGSYWNWPFIVILLLSSFLIFVVRESNESSYSKLRSNCDCFEAVILLLFLSVSIRGMVGLALEFPWKSNGYLLVLLTLAVVFGKALGGKLADRYGWIRVATLALIIVAPLLSFLRDNPATAIIGVFLFNMTMPITLAALSNMLPGREGFAFGLSTLALIAGALPTFTNLKYMLNSRWFVLGTILLSMVMLSKALIMGKEINRGHQKFGSEKLAVKN